MFCESNANFNCTEILTHVSTLRGAQFNVSVVALAQGNVIMSQVLLVKLYRYSRKRYIRQIMMKLKPLLDSYYVPHEKHSRFWHGLLLLVRCGLFIVFASDYVHGSRSSLLAVGITFTLLIVFNWLLSWFSIRVYKSIFINTIETLVFLNLIILSVQVSCKVEWN